MAKSLKILKHVRARDGIISEPWGGVVLAKDTHTEQQNRIESLEINLYIYTQLDIDKEARTIQWGKQHSFQQMNN